MEWRKPQMEAGITIPITRFRKIITVWRSIMVPGGILRTENWILDTQGCVSTTEAGGT